MVDLGEVNISDSDEATDWIKTMRSKALVDWTHERILEALVDVEDEAEDG